MRRSRKVLAVALSTVVGLLPGPVRAAPPDPAGGPRTAQDVYRYLEDPQRTGEGQEEPHADLRPYPDARSAVADLTERSAANPHVRSLNGAWRLKIFPRPDDVPTEFHGDGFDASGWPAATVPHTWQSDFLDHPVFRNIPTEIVPDDPPKVPRDVNPTGAYVRTVDLPADWAGDRVVLRFEGVTSGFFVWVNGGYAGYDQGGYTPAEFDVTARLRPGRNQIAVQVHRWGSGAYLEDVDQWRYSGIFRDVWLYRTAPAYLRDAYLTTDLDDDHRDAVLRARVDVAGAAGRYRVRASLRDPAGRPVTTVTGTAGAGGRVILTAPVTAPALWSAEEPRLYALVLQLVAADGTVLHTTAQPVGFRGIEVRGKQIRVNGNRILIKGVNRAETDPDTGRHNTRERQRADVFAMKRLHVNAVRTAHYPSDPYLYRLADRHGLWVADEVDIETHNRETCPSNCLADRPEWQAAFADRFRAMVERDKNHPSVIFWDTGNEAGLGAAHRAMAAWADANEPTRLLYHQPNVPDGTAPFADVDGPRYPTPARLEARVNASAKPVVMGEYAHAMGNGLGNVDRFWELARRNPQMQGGFIWDWAEQNLRQPLVLTPDSSPSGIQAFLVGRPGPAPGRRGQAVSLSGLDDFVDVFRDRRLDLTGPLTLDAWVKPGEWAGSFPILTKGQGYALQMRDRDTLEFGVDAGGWATAAADVPDDWYDTWHRVTGVYDGEALRLYVDGDQVATTARSGPVDPGLHEVNLGRNAETQQDNDLRNARTGRGLIDDARIYGTALSKKQMRNGDDPAGDAVLALNFDDHQPRGDFLSLGISLSGTDGLVGADRTLQPETAEMAWAHAPLRFTAAGGDVRVRNEQQAGTYDVRVRWTIAEQGRTLKSGARRLTLGPGESADVGVAAAPANPHDRERFLDVTAETVKPVAWAPAGWVVGYDQFAVGGRAVPGIRPLPASGAPSPATDGGTITVRGPGFDYRFDDGVLASMRVRGAELLHGGLQLDVYRPPTSNETYEWGTDDRRIWHETGLDRLRTTVRTVDTRTEADAVVVEVRSTVAAPGAETLLSFDQTMRYRIDGRGTIDLAHDVVPQGDRAGDLPYLPRVGVALRLPDRMQRFAYYGRGPHESYNDRRSGARTGVYRSTVEREYVRYSRPQAYGNHTDARWATLHDGTAGLLVGGMTDVSVTPYDDLDRAEYDHQLPLVRNAGWVTLHAGAGETGMGETPNSVLTPYALSPTRAYSHELVLRPLTVAEVRADGVPDPDVPAPCPPDLTVRTDGADEAGQAERVRVTVGARCAAGLRPASAWLTAPDGWTVAPAVAELGAVAAGEPETATFTVTPPAGTDAGRYDLTATAVTTTPDGFTSTTTRTATVDAPLPAGWTWLSDRPYTVGRNGWGPVEKDRSNGEQGDADGGPLTVGGVTYPKGLGAHAVSTIVVELGGSCTRLRADVGIDDEIGTRGSAGFEVWVDGEQRAKSAVLTGRDPAQRLDVDVTGGRRLELRATDGGDGTGGDHADWAGARLACA